MELAMGAMAPLFPKLLQLLENKYVEQRGLKREVEFLSMEMEMVHAALMEDKRYNIVVDDVWEKRTWETINCVLPDKDCFIKKSTLIWRWIAEGFVQLQKEGHRSLFEVGERYFNELLNRSMIQPANTKPYDIITGCRVHDIVLDLIRDLSHEENFVTMLDEKQFLPLESVARKHGSERKVRRMSVRNRMDTTTVAMAEVVRSLDARDCLINVSMLSSFQACRVLSLKDGIYNGDLKHLGKLLHLRYLELTGVRDDHEVPKEIGNLKSLQTLIIINIVSSIVKLPPTVCELTQLMCLNAYRSSLVRADRLGRSLVCLEQLNLQIHKKECDDFVVELGKLTRLRVLYIYFRYRSMTNEASKKALMQSLNKLQEIRELTVLWAYRELNDVTLWESWEPPQQLRRLNTNSGSSLYLMDPSRFLRLVSLRIIAIDEEGDMGYLPLLPELQVLDIKVSDPDDHQGFIIYAQGFQNLRVYRTETRLKFLQGAMPRLEFLGLGVRPGRDTIPDLEEINLVTLLSLKEVNIEINCEGSFRREVEEAEAVLRRAVEDHPNPPMLHIRRLDEWLMLADDKMKPDKVVHALVKVRECRRDEWDEICDDVNMRLYCWLEEITCDIDTEGSRLSQVEEIEAQLRSDAAFHPKRPKLVMNRVNQDKMLGDDGAWVGSDDGALADSY
ncbi:hypothetical protein QOZ80_9AG0670610 [Eleusine coracana subsp. coracana]|nr:hypothetical protein QOZ80_9AG0670610 [Eleusine coracana subsp. coracana]